MEKAIIKYLKMNSIESGNTILKRPPFVPKPPTFRSYRLYRNQTLLN